MQCSAANEDELNLAQTGLTTPTTNDHNASSRSYLSNIIMMMLGVVGVLMMVDSQV